MAIHAKLTHTPYQFKAIAKGLQQYVISPPERCEEIAKSTFKEWGFGPYWHVAVQLTNPTYRAQIASIIDGKKDRDQAAHGLVMFFLENPQPIDSSSLIIADAQLY